MNVYNNNWLGKTLNVISSLDNTLVGRQGMVVDESQKTITIKEDGKMVKLGKASIKFTITDSDVVIDGTMVGQRPENRVHRKYRMA
ncbi:MAG: ribonuclease P protein subunit [Candidatus Poseidoniaceae archaeon]|jgi:RNase P/RNase MRP subunit p29|nr:ribonuclease P protein subunit [Candidatus Poseidoniaceae archaeon]MDG1549256.1 ribonuclease P protein subunit [Candidatus Poseidoniaceae archaeon]|tara:strand:- start:1667 stop:1924 length:258 start_codon:yes stop_codon:yes gene_type:complete